MDKLVTNAGQDMALIEKYARSGPRYTSYPTAPQFGESFPVDDYLRDARSHQLGSLSLYVHIPFCQDICYYCACNKIVTREPGTAQRYLASLRREIAMQAEIHGKRRPVRQMHWGGGSPTYLDNAEVTELMHDLASHFTLMDSGVREYSMELDPRTTAAGAIPLMKGLGFNRVSLGIQDFDPLVQKSINRVQPFKMVRKLVDEIRHFDFRSLSFDLIYGLPHQDSLTMESTLQKVIELRPDRIACFNYAHLPDRFKSQRAIDRLTLPSPSDKLALQWQIADTLQAAGYVHIGLDHYVLPDDDLAQAQRDGKLQRNFQGYSLLLADDLVGMGVSSISQVGDYYVQNARGLDDYYSDVDAGKLPIHRGYRTSSEDRLRRHVIMSLICNLSLDLDSCELPGDASFWQHFEQEIAALEDMQADGLLALENDRISITEQGRPFLRNVCMVFDQYLNPPESAANSPRYSAVI
ncbi:MAG: oxygen-independent coproporphyrinogen III oxidase [Halieaceae bacterium]|nr:oxygen-independent coproporphyrinogen III oxidase [Halieaceae bacterium]